MINNLFLIVVIIIHTFANEVLAVELELFARQKFAGNLKLGAHIVGGLSQIQVVEDKLWAICDDRGKFGGPRFLIFNIANTDTPEKLSLKYLETKKVKLPNGYKVGDFEAFYKFKDGAILISSEGDLNQKPRVLPFVGFWQEKSGWSHLLTLPQEFIAEKTGMQTKGLRNNLAFESLAVDSDESRIWLWSESSLMQSTSAEVEVLEYHKQELKKPRARHQYKRELSENSKEFFRGVSDALYEGSGSRFLVLERWLEFSTDKIREIKSALFLYDLESRKKSKIYTFHKEFSGNWEALAWLPGAKGAEKILIVANDNNFDKSTPTEFLFFRYKP